MAKCSRCGEEQRGDCMNGWLRPADTDEQVRECPNAVARREWQAQARRQREAQEFTESYPIPKRYAGARVDLCPESAREAAQEAAGGAIVLCGVQGAGKSFLAAALAHEAVARGELVAWIQAGQLVQDLRQLIQDPVGFADYREDLERADLLVIDDVGKQRRTEFADEMLWNLVSARYDACKRMIVTTNLSKDDLQGDHIWGSIVERLIEDATVVRYEGASRRKASREVVV